jgi:hypothetical protein
MLVDGQAWLAGRVGPWVAFSREPVDARRQHHLDRGGNLDHVHWFASADTALAPRRAPAAAPARDVEPARIAACERGARLTSTRSALLRRLGWVVVEQRTDET